MSELRVEILAIGDELLDGRVADTNTLRLAEALAGVGLRLAQRTTVLDDIDAIVREAEAVVARGTQLCVVSGGLGPTADDVTAEALAHVAAVPLRRDAAQAEQIRAYIEGRGRAVTDNQLRQADRPQGSTLIDNPVGTAPGFALVHRQCRFVAVPGVPHEFDRLVADAVIAPLAATRGAMLRQLIATFGLLEAEVDERLSPMATRFPSVRLGFRVVFPTIEVSLKAVPDDAATLAAASAFVRAALGDNIVSERGESLAAVVLARLHAVGATVATAESCTGGLVADLLTDVPGASRAYLGSVVAYANEAKLASLAVRPETLAAHGAVSEACVLEMARGAQARFGATYGISTSGVAGPEGGTPEKPLGTVWLGIAGPKAARARKLSFPFERRRNKLVSAYAALDLLRREIGSGSEPQG